MRKAILATAFVAGTVGFVAGAAAWYLFSPLLFDEVVAEAAPRSTELMPVASGTFRDADRAHSGTGTATILASDDETVLRFEAFEVTNGPDLEVWLVKAANVQSSADVKASEWLSLGQLKGNVGDQNYSVPPGTEIGDYPSVVIWCEQFGVLFSAADMAPAS